MARRSRTSIEGMDELESMIRQLEKVPQKVVTKAAQAGARIALRSAKADAPVDTGDLKSALVMKPERKRKPGKKMYNIKLDPAKNDLFVKESKAGKRSYYPASQEYGFKTVNGGYIPGYRYLRKSIEDNESAIESKIVDVAVREIDKIMRR
ncbi:HK97 gp10 family phage protein [Paenibacillus harenae]|uniref:HK97 gp10 family phage protein n=1 Tax=Paenibacillus harenae TaxID=306543 RepID=UPI00041F8EAA|nr:HK97 gp10 family phage protein [Paenibacillus harenae]